MTIRLSIYSSKHFKSHALYSIANSFIWNSEQELILLAYMATLPFLLYCQRWGKGDTCTMIILSESYRLLCLCSFWIFLNCYIPNKGDVLRCYIFKSYFPLALRAQTHLYEYKCIYNESDLSLETSIFSSYTTVCFNTRHLFTNFMLVLKLPLFFCHHCMQFIQALSRVSKTNFWRTKPEYNSSWFVC